MKKFNIILILCLSLILSVLWSCHQKKEGIKIMFIGIDALDWEVLDQLVLEGAAPNFIELIQNGASAKINSNDKNVSAVYWTTIATGQLSTQHGITDFVTIDPATKERIPVTSNMRKSKAFWNIFSENNIDVGVIGWYVSWPAEKVKGFIVSSYFAVKDSEQLTWKGTFYEDTPHMTYPEDLNKDVNRYVQTAKERYLINIKKIIKPSALDKDYGVIRETKWAFLTDEIYNEIGLNLYPKLNPQVFAVYFVGVDVVGHRFTFPKKARQRGTNLQFGNVQRNYYLYMDEVLGKYVPMADENTVIIVAADHGLMRGHHTNNGAFIISGPGIKQNVRSSTPINLTDIFPTMLYIMGLPVANDMDGEVFIDAFQDNFLAKNKIHHISSYGKREDVTQAPKRSQFDEKIVKRLKALGYIK